MDHRLERKISIVLPVYSGISLLKELMVSLESTIRNGQLEYVEEIIIVNDNPNNNELADFLTDWLRFPSLPYRLITNERNRGFVCSVNRGMSEANKDTDVMLLNSDTRVFGRWLNSFA